MVTGLLAALCAGLGVDDALLADGPEGWRAARRTAGAACAEGSREGCVADAVLAIHDEPDGRLRPDVPAAERQRARRVFAEGCDAGVPRACTALGVLYGAGYGTYLSAGRARVSLDRGCELGDPVGCALLEGPLPAPDDPAPFAPALAAGLRGDALLTELDAWCAASSAACREATWVRQGAEPVADAIGRYSDDRYLRRALFDALPGLRRCHVAALAKDPHAGGVLDLWARVDAEGTVVGLAVPGAGSDLEGCLASEVVGVRLPPPLDGVADLHAELALVARAEVSLRSTATALDDGIVPELARRWSSRGSELDACVLANEPPGGIEGIGVRGTLGGDGVPSEVRWDDPDLAPATLACLERALRVPSGVRSEGPRGFAGEIRFFVERGFEPGVWVPPPGPEPERALRLVAIVPATVEIEGDGYATAPLASRIADAHRRLAAAVAAWTGGRLRVEVRTVRWNGALPGVTAWSDEGLRRARLAAIEVPRDALADVPGGSADGIVVWVPGDPGDLVAGVTDEADTARGAVLSVVPAGEDADPLFPLLHAVWSQLRVRAADRLGVELPSPERVLLLDGAVRDPAWWLADLRFDPHESGYRPFHADAAALALRYGGRDVAGRRAGDPLPFYAAMFGSVLHPAILEDLDRLDAAERAPDDLARSGRPIGGSAREVERVNDGHVGYAVLGEPVPDRARVAADETAEAWFGVAWEGPVEVAALAGWFADPGAEPTVAELAWEVRRGGRWHEVGRTVPTAAESRLDLPEPVAADAVRARVVRGVPGVEPTCLELSVARP